MTPDHLSGPNSQSPRRRRGEGQIVPLHSAGLLVFDDTGDELLVFLAHMGGPFWAHKDSGAWSIPKGLYDPEVEQPEGAARREFEEEIGAAAPTGTLTDLGEVRQRSGKVVRAFAVRAEPTLAFVGSNQFTMEWPPRSGRLAEFPEIDRAEWFTLEDASVKLVAGQVAFLQALSSHLDSTRG